MLIPAAAGVNRARAAAQRSTVAQESHELLKLLENIVLPALERRRPQRVLLVSRDPGAFPDLEPLAHRGVVRMHAGPVFEDDPLACDSAALPFQDESFEVVIMHHVFSDGAEPEFRETRRILAGGGDLFVLGKGSLGLRSRFGSPGDDLPALKVRTLCRRLQASSFRIEHCVGVGLLGIPVSCERRWQQPALPFADSVLIMGHHRTAKPIVTPLRFSQPQTVGVQSAVADHLSREAV